MVVGKLGISSDPGNLSVLTWCCRIWRTSGSADFEEELDQTVSDLNSFGVDFLYLK